MNGSALVVSGLLALAAWGHAAALPKMPGPAPQHRRESAEQQNRACERCHAAIAREWRESYHRLAYADVAVQRALRSEPVPFCRRCHAPEADPQRPATGWAADSGVACVTCHLLAGRIVTGPGDKGGGQRAPHALLRDPRFAAADACARCHEFSFPDGQLRRRPELMQSTVREHAESPHNDATCIDCHMPRAAGGHRSHRFVSAHDAGVLRAALQVHGARAGATALSLELLPGWIGHALPTGDLFRRLKVVVAVPGAPGASQVRYLQRFFTAEQQIGWVRVTQRDTRLREPTTLHFTFDEQARGQPIKWRVLYQRVAHPLPTDQGSAVLDGEVELAQGEVR